MPQRPWFKFYPSDWRNEKTLKLVSRAARSLWIDLIGLIHEGGNGRLQIGDIPPTPKDIAQVLGDDPRTVRRLLSELEGAGVFSRDGDGFIISRRLVRENLRSEIAAKHGQVGWQKRQKEAKNELPTLQGDPSPRSYMLEAREEVLNQAYKPTLPNNSGNGRLLLDDRENYIFSGDYVQVTHQEYEAMQKAYPDLNVLGVIRSADQRYPRRMKKSMTPRAYLESVLSFKDEELRNIRVERRTERQDDGAPDQHARSLLYCRDKRLWWRQEGSRHLRMGIWNAHLWGPEPWKDRTECPVGTFSAEELEELRVTFEQEEAKKLAEERNAEIASGGFG